MADDRELTPELVGEVLGDHGVPTGRRMSIRPLSGGVSADVVLVTIDDREALVIKRPRQRLAVAAEWLVARDRAFNEVECLRYLETILPSGSVPQVRLVDRERCLFGMEALPAPRATWKEQLFDGSATEETAVRVGELLAVIHRTSSGQPGLSDLFDREELFVDARVDPFHREIARRHPQLAAAIGAEIDRMRRDRRALTWGDASPKNVFAYPERVCFFDVEIAHWGDPAFDVAYFLTHLTLKATVLKSRRERVLGYAAAFWASYRNGTPSWDGFEAHILTEVGCLLLARIDGKSPVDYVSEAADREAVVELGCRLVNAQIGSVAELLDATRQARLPSHERVAR